MAFFELEVNKFMVNDYYNKIVDTQASWHFTRFHAICKKHDLCFWIANADYGFRPTSKGTTDSEGQQINVGFNKPSDFDFDKETKLYLFKALLTRYRMRLQIDEHNVNDDINECYMEEHRLKFKIHTKTVLKLIGKKRK